MTAAADHKADTATTTLKNHEGTTAKITESSVYTHEVKDGSTVFTGTPLDAAPVYFKTNDGIKTEMYLSGKLTHTRVTVPVSYTHLDVYKRQVLTRAMTRHDINISRTERNIEKEIRDRC